MQLSSRAKQVSESITLKLNQQAVKMAESGKQVFNLTAGQLPFKPPAHFIEKIHGELNFIKSYQYAPVPGFRELRDKFMEYTESNRGIALDRSKFDCVISNGAKHTVYNTLGTLIDPGDEVILLAPYWVSYPEMIRFWGGEPIAVGSTVHSAFTPEIAEIKKAISFNTRAIIINSPNNPTGTHYSKEWMGEFAALMMEHPDITIISDEIYYELTYFDPPPVYFYQLEPALLERTIIVDGISKCLASTGLRIGYCIGPKSFTSSFGKIQAQTTSGANSLIQRSLKDFSYDELRVYLTPIREHLRNNAAALREALRENNCSSAWYQTTSAFYFLIDFSATPIVARMREAMKTQTEVIPPDHDFSAEICENLLEKKGLAMVPSSAFGVPNAARMSLVLEEGPFKEAIARLMDFINDK